MALGLVRRARGPGPPRPAGRSPRCCRRRSRFRTGTTRTSSRPSRATSGASTRAPYSPVRIHSDRVSFGQRSEDGRVLASGGVGWGRRRGGRRGSPRRGRRRPRRRSRPWCPARRRCRRGARRRRPGPCRCRPRAWGSPRRRRRAGTAGRPAGSTRRRRTRAAAEHRVEDALPLLDGVDDGRRLLDRVRAPPGSSFEWRLTPRGTTHSDASSGYSSSTPASVSSSTAPSFTPGHTTTWPCTSMPWSSSARSQRRLVAPRRLRSMRRARRGRWRGCSRRAGDSRSVTTRSRSASVNRVSVVKFP